MQNTTNYNFNIPEGTDLWNYLTQTNPNFTALDSILKSVSDATVTTATEVTSGTAHAITRTLPDANVIRFTATGVWALGDTMTIDGTPVTVVKPNGTSLQTGDYIIGSEVLGVLRATQFTVYLGAPSSLDAADIDYDNTQSGLTATNVQEAVDEINSKLYAQATGTTITDLKTAVMALSDTEYKRSQVEINSGVYKPEHTGTRQYGFFAYNSNSANAYVYNQIMINDNTPNFTQYVKKMNGTTETTPLTVSSWILTYIKD